MNLERALLGDEQCSAVCGVVVGCDNRRSVPFDLKWARDIVAQCKAAGVPVYVKQLRDFKTGRLLTYPEDFPEDLRIRELPWTLTTKKP